MSPAAFLMATRDSGYKTTGLAVAELIDNSIQAGATRVDVSIRAGSDAEYPVEIDVIDDGAGMDAKTLATALSFGGSSRFDDRSSLGRYGMGLPNGALSRARRLEVYSWRDGRTVLGVLDVDDFVARRRRSLPPILGVDNVEHLPTSPSGTAVRLRRCDRLEFKKVSTLAERLGQELARIYRRFLDGGLRVSVNGKTLQPFDPLLLMPGSSVVGGRPFGDPIVYRVDGVSGPGMIHVRFSELPVERWHALSADEKRAKGVTTYPSVSVLRAEREIDSGWFFMGAKRRENYDDWWRCEVSFDPELDELFGLTNAKQSIGPRSAVADLLAPDLEPVARALNTRVRRRFELAKVATPLEDAQRRAARTTGSLRPLRSSPKPPPEILQLVAAAMGDADDSGSPYRVVVCDLPSTQPFEVVVRKGTLSLLLNAQHPWFRQVLGPLAISDQAPNRALASDLTLGLLAAGRVEAELSRPADREVAARLRHAWGDVVASFLTS